MQKHVKPASSQVWEGKEVIKTGRKLVGATNPLDAEPGTIRGDFCVEVGRFVTFTLIYSRPSIRFLVYIS